MKRVIIPFVFIFFIVSVYAQTAGGGSYTIEETCDYSNYLTIDECNGIVEERVIEEQKLRYNVMLVLVLFGVGVYILKRKKRHTDFIDNTFIKEDKSDPIDFSMVREGLKNDEEKLDKLEKEIEVIKKDREEVKEPKMDDKYFK